MRDPAFQTSMRQRRRLLKAASAAVLTSPLISLLGCHREPAAGTPATTPSTADAAAPPWASGGTRAIGDAARFPDPFAAGNASTACVLTCTTTIGPCHTTSPERIDVSDGWDGLPLRLALRVVDTDCKPVQDAIVEIWHTNHTGGYSGQIVKMCNNNEDDLDKQFFRGYQRSDKDGRVNFNTCYPGWYRGRVVHIHLRVLTGDYDANDRAVSTVTTQLMFSDQMNQQIFSSQALYSVLGQPDTQLAADNVVGGESDFAPYLFDVKRMDDGVMFASKTLVIRKSNEEATCQAKGRMPERGPDGRRGPPPQGSPPDGMLPPPQDAAGKSPAGN